MFIMLVARLQMDLRDCLKVHGYICTSDDSDSTQSDVEEIYEKYKPKPVPYEQMKDRIVVIRSEPVKNDENTPERHMIQILPVINSRKDQNHTAYFMPLNNNSK